VLSEIAGVARVVARFRVERGVLYVDAMTTARVGSVRAICMVGGETLRRSFVMWALVIGLGAPARAGDTKPLSETLEGPAKEAFDTGKFLFNEDPAKAYAKFKRAHELSGDARLLYDMAVCEKALKHYARMQVLLTRYLAEGGPLVSPESRQASTETLRAVKPFVDSLTIRIAESGAMVTIDQEEVGTTPLAAPLPVDVGAHVIEIHKAGFLPFKRKIDASGGEEKAIDAVLVAESRAGRLVVESDPSAQITVDDTTVGSRFDEALPGGTHMVKIRAPGKRGYDGQVDLAPGATRTMQVSLEKEGLPLWAYIGGGALLAAGLTVGAYFLFRPADKPGPQQQGTIFTVPASWSWR
jgi:hypothetical protein